MKIKLFLFATMWPADTQLIFGLDDAADVVRVPASPLHLRWYMGSSIEAIAAVVSWPATTSNTISKP
jgi:hypothetical protein